MAFRVEISPEALENLDTIATHIQQRGSFENAERWFDEIVIAIRSLCEMPTRCPLADESNDLQTEVRLPLHGKAIAATKSTSRFIMRRKGSCL